MTFFLSQRPIAAFLACAGLLVPSGPFGAGHPPKTPRGNPTLILDSPGGERTIPAVDLSFVYFERIYYRRRAPRSQEATGQRVDLEDRRHECQCVRLEDSSKVKFSKVRQIEIAYPPGERIAQMRVTLFDGRLRELRADSLFGVADSFAPRFAARVDGEVREFLLILPEGGTWPQERLVRVLLKRPPPRRGRR